METSPLNKAHQLERKAESLLKQKKFEESIECHRSAVKYFHEASNLTENSRSRESIQLQIDNNQKMMESLKIKKSQYEDHRRWHESNKHRIANYECMCENSETLQHEIFRTMETHDSLIEILMKRNVDDECLKSFISDDDKSVSVDTCDGFISGKKRQVDESTLLEEFKELSEKLRELVQILVLQLEDKDLEIMRLKSEVYKLECEKKKDANKTNNTLKVITDSSGGTSPFVFSPCSELSPDVNSLGDLPTLAPLEMPNFDFASLMKNTKNININGTNNNKE